MQTYISLLRGINVGGKKSIKMDALSELCKQIGFSNVKTYIQSGNIVYQADNTNTTQLSNQLAEAIAEHYGFDVPTLTYSVAELASIIAQNPFTQADELAQLYITYVDKPPTNDAKAGIESKKSSNEQLHITDKAIYICATDGYGKTKLTNTLIESKLNATATTRNWKTSDKLLHLAQQLTKQ